MSDELRQAAERLRNWMVDVFHCNMATVQQDTMALAKAYLDEHLVDDDEKATKEWLDEVSLVTEPNKWIIGRSRFAAVWAEAGMGTIRFYVGLQSIHRSPTRGQLRLLCRALGVEIKAVRPCE